LAPVVREQTLKSVLVIINKLTDRVINGELLKHLAKTANDEQPGIRTNTTICLGKIAKNLGSSTRSKVLIAAFTRSLRDPFVHARNAALLAFAATVEYFNDEDCAGRILPAICPSLIDKEKLIREQANKTMEIYLHKVRKSAADMPDSVLPPEPTTGDARPRMSTPRPSETASWAGWAISSFTNKLHTAAGEIEPSASNGASASTHDQAKVTSPVRSRPATATSSASTLHRQAVKSPVPPTLSRNSSVTNADVYFKDSEPDEDDGADFAWGGMDAMDDDGAWGEDTQATTSPAASSSSTKLAAKKETVPFDDGSEPDFAGWLAAQAQKKTGSKPLPKGLSKAAKKPAAARPAATKKNIDLRPREAAGDDDGWGDGW
jgi:SCY1-like protein 1